MTKAKSKKTVTAKVWTDTESSVVFGQLAPGRGRPEKQAHLLNVVAEKLPYASLPAVRKHAVAAGLAVEGVYMAHDSMGYPRYAGRGNVFSRLAAHQRNHPGELCYFSFYLIAHKKNEREIETIIIRAAAGMLDFNDRKRAVTTEVGDVRDYEPRTMFYERQRRKGPRPKRKTER